MIQILLSNHYISVFKCWYYRYIYIFGNTRSICWTITFLTIVYSIWLLYIILSPRHHFQYIMYIYMYMHYLSKIVKVSFTNMMHHSSITVFCPDCFQFLSFCSYMYYTFLPTSTKRLLFTPFWYRISFLIYIYFLYLLLYPFFGIVFLPFFSCWLVHNNLLYSFFLVYIHNPTTIIITRTITIIMSPKTEELLKVQHKKEIKTFESNQRIALKKVKGTAGKGKKGKEILAL